MAPVPLIQQPEHGKARHTAEVTGVDRVLPKLRPRWFVSF